MISVGTIVLYKGVYIDADPIRDRGVIIGHTKYNGRDGNLNIVRWDFPPDKVGNYEDDRLIVYAYLQLEFFILV